MYRKLSIASALTAVVILGASAAGAETCVEKAAEGSGPNREAALRQAYATALQAVDPQLLRQWLAAGMRVGEAPGHAVRKLSVNCAQGGPGQLCKIDVTICKP